MKKLVSVVALSAALALTGCSTVVANDGGSEPATAASNAPAASKAAAPAPAPKKADNVPSEYKTALKSAEMYVSTMPMSKAGLLAQLTSDVGGKFSAEAGKYAVDNVKADWKENAVKSAKTYQETMAMSPNAIKEQLVSEYGDKYTAEEAEYAVSKLG